VIRNYLSLAMRQIARNRFVSAVKVLSLAIGLAAMLLALMYVGHELSYDRWIPNAENIYRYETELLDSGGTPVFLASAPSAAGETLKNRFSEIEEVTRFSQNLHSLHKDGEVHYEWVIFADENFLEVLDLPLLAGDRSTVLSGALSALISQEMSLKHFGGMSPIGETLTVENIDGGEKLDFMITGVFRDIPDNSHLALDIILRNQPGRVGFGHQEEESWNMFPTFTYLVLSAGSSPGTIEAGLPALMDDRVDVQGTGRQKRGSEVFRPYLSRLTGIHMNQKNLQPMRPPGDWGLIYALGGIALLVMAIASINFMNLALARSLSRSREVAMRKALGARRAQLICQYLVETGILALMAMALALALVALALPSLNALVSKRLALDALYSPSLLLSVLSLLVMVAVLSGLYPALVISSFRPAAVFRSERSKSRKGRALRNGLVIFQFAICIALGLDAAVIRSQQHFISSYDLGYSSGDKLVLRWMNWGHFAEKSPMINERIRQLPAVAGTAYSGIVPGDPWQGNVPLSRGDFGVENPVRGRATNVDENFFEVYGVELVAGRFLSREFGADRVAEDAEGDEEIRQFSIIVNESAVQRLGFESAETTLGAMVKVGDETLQPTIVGVVRDAHFSSLKTEVLPTIFYMAEAGFANLTVRFVPGTDIPALVREITGIWKDYIPREPVTIEFLDELLAAHYQDDQRQGMMLNGFAILALVLACVGLFALSALTVAEQAREVSIRKVYGASVFRIMSLMLWRFSFPVLIAIVFAWPLAWIAARQYLDNFSYRMELEPATFVVAGLAAVLIAWATVACHALKVATCKPIHTLRTN
jgi:putative ABC transport system permease protein